MNIAKRLLGIFDALLGQGAAAGPSSAYWAQALGIGNRSDLASEDELILALQAFRAEVETVVALLTAKGFSADLFASQFARLRHAASPTSINAEWRSMVGNISPSDVRLALAWAAASLPDDQPELLAADLQALTAEFDQLGAAIEGADLPPAMKAYAIKQLRTLRAALRMYNVRGITAVQEALEQAYGAASKAQPELAAEAGANPTAWGFVDKINGLITRTMGVCESVETMHKGGAAVLSMAKGFQGLLDLVKGAP